MSTRTVTDTDILNWMDKQSEDEINLDFTDGEAGVSHYVITIAWAEPTMGVTARSVRDVLIAAMERDGAA